MHYVYALQSLKDGHLYIGLSANPEKRLLEHNSGLTRSLRGRRPLRLIYREECRDRIHARQREKYLKSGIGREFLRKIASALA